MIIKITEQDRDYRDSVFTWYETLSKEDYEKRKDELEKRIGKDYYFTVIEGHN